jgi:hypothetical protein
MGFYERGPTHLTDCLSLSSLLPALIKTSSSSPIEFESAKRLDEKIIDIEGEIWWLGGQESNLGSQNQKPIPLTCDPE